MSCVFFLFFFSMLPICGYRLYKYHVLVNNHGLISWSVVKS